MGWGGKIMCLFQTQPFSSYFYMIYQSKSIETRGLDIFSYDNVQRTSPLLFWPFSSLRSSFRLVKYPSFSASCLMVHGVEVASRWRLTSWWLFCPFFPYKLTFFAFFYYSYFSFPSLRQLSSRARGHPLPYFPPCIICRILLPDKRIKSRSAGCKD